MVCGCRAAIGSGRTKIETRTTTATHRGFCRFCLSAVRRQARFLFCATVRAAYAALATVGATFGTPNTGTRTASAAFDTIAPTGGRPAKRILNSILEDRKQRKK